MASCCTSSEASDLHANANHDGDDECSTAAAIGMEDQSATDEAKHDSERYCGSFVWVVEPNVWTTGSVCVVKQTFIMTRNVPPSTVGNISVG